MAASRVHLAMCGVRWVTLRGLLVVGDQVVRGGGVAGEGLGVDGGGGEPTYAVHEVVFDLVTEVVGIDQ